MFDCVIAAMETGSVPRLSEQILCEEEESRASLMIEAPRNNGLWPGVDKMFPPHSEHICLFLVLLKLHFKEGVEGTST